MSLPHNVQKIADILLNLPSELPIVVFQANDRDNKNFNFKIRRNVALKASKTYWLRKHNVLYKNVLINMKRVNQLPEDDYLNVSSITINERSKSPDAYDCGAVEDKENSIFTHTNVQPKELDRLKDSLEPTPPNY